MLSKISSEIYSFDSLISLGQFPDDFPIVIGAAIIDNNEFKIRIDLLNGYLQSFV